MEKPPPSDVSLGEFILEMKDDISRFEALWRARNQENPGQYPMKMLADNSGAWLEQFIMFLETGG